MFLLRRARSGAPRRRSPRCTSRPTRCAHAVTSALVLWSSTKPNAGRAVARVVALPLSVAALFTRQLLELARRTAALPPHGHPFAAEERTARAACARPPAATSGTAHRRDRSSIACASSRSASAAVAGVRRVTRRASVPASMMPASGRHDLPMYWPGRGIAALAERVLVGLGVVLSDERCACLRRRPRSSVTSSGFSLPSASAAARSSRNASKSALRRFRPLWALRHVAALVALASPSSCSRRR